MCGEIQKWQTKRSCTVRVISTGARTYRIVLPKQFLDAQEVWLDEYMILGFGASGTAYLDLAIQNMHAGCVGNENVPGVCIAVDVLNPHVVLSRPRQLLLASGSVNFNEFQLGLQTATGPSPVTLTATTFTEMMLVLTVVMRKPKEEIEEYRRLAAMMEIPQIKAPDPRNSFMMNPELGW